MEKQYEELLKLIYYRKVKIVGFIGPIGTGKSYQAEYLSKLLKQIGKIPIQYSLASKLKELTLEIYGKSKVMNLSDDDCYFAENIAERYFGEDHLKDLEELKCKDIRTILQVFGTNIMREKIYKDIHIRYFLDFYYSMDKKSNWIILIDDIRFDNEIKEIKRLGGLLVYVNRDKNNILKSLNISEDIYNKMNEHDSEKEWKVFVEKKKYDFELIVNT